MVRKRKRGGWEWENSNKKRAKSIMLAMVGQDYDAVCARISAECNIPHLDARALYRRVVATELTPDTGFVPAPIRRGRKPKTVVQGISQPYHSKKTTTDSIMHRPLDVAPVAPPKPVEVKRTATGERLSISEMKKFLAAQSLPEPKRFDKPVFDDENGDGERESED